MNRGAPGQGSAGWHKDRVLSMADCEEACERDPLQYPFGQPEHDCVWSRGDVLDLAAWRGAGLAGRAPVLAIGSNASPQQLGRKFTPEVVDGLGSEDGDIPILRASAFGIDVVYGAYISSYGAIPATAVQAGPEARVEVWLTWLTPAQLERMDCTEGRQLYPRRCVRRVERHGEHVEGAQCYVLRRGAAVLGGHLVGLSSVPSQGGLAPERREQLGVWDLLAADLGRPSGADLNAEVRCSPVLKEQLRRRLADQAANKWVGA